VAVEGAKPKKKEQNSKKENLSPFLPGLTVLILLLLLVLKKTKKSRRRKNARTKNKKAV
jgi:hypothetical protein